MQTIFDKPMIAAISVATPGTSHTKAINSGTWVLDSTGTVENDEGNGFHFRESK